MESSITQVYILSYKICVPFPHGILNPYDAENLCICVCVWGGGVVLFTCVFFNAIFFEVRAKTNKIRKNIFIDNISNTNIYCKQHTKDKTYVLVDAYNYSIF